MKIYLVNAEHIYFPKIKEYFREIISSYDNGNYRSAMVMLYSTIVCDLLLKLKELSDVYGDSKAEKLLEEVDQERKKMGNSTWEWKLIKLIKDRTELLSDESYAMLNHIYDLRNFSAHPAMNEDYELISPTPEMTIAYIKKALDDIFIKPSVFAQNIVDRMSEDIALKKDMYRKDQDGLNRYLEKVYFERMSDKMMSQVFKAFWKFTYIKVDDEPFGENRAINNRVIRAMFENREDVIVKYISENKSYFLVAQNDACLRLICITLALFPRAYDVLDDTVKHQIQSYDKQGINIVKWFVGGNLETHIKKLIASDGLVLEVFPTMLLKNICEKYGELSLFSELVIKYYSKSASFATGRDRFKEFIAPYLSIFGKEEIVKLIEVINGNNQIYECWGQQARNDEIMKRALVVLPKNFEYDKYEHFVFTKQGDGSEESDANSRTSGVDLDSLPF